jgi:cell fate regulator YaaT (PSP1 superfamily)
MWNIREIFKVTFYYTADNRVDFRQLIKDYAGAFRTKIDMKQIGFRQEAAKVGGIGSCGRALLFHGLQISDL